MIKKSSEIHAIDIIQTENNYSNLNLDGDFFSRKPEGWPLVLYRIYFTSPFQFQLSVKSLLNSVYSFN